MHYPSALNFIKTISNYGNWCEFEPIMFIWWHFLDVLSCLDYISLYTAVCHLDNDLYENQKE